MADKEDKHKSTQHVIYNQLVNPSDTRLILNIKELLENKIYPDKNVYINAYNKLQRYLRLGKVFELQINRQKSTTKDLAAKTFLVQVKQVSKKQRRCRSTHDKDTVPP